TPQGIMTLVAGTGAPCAAPTSACGDGGAATQAQLSQPGGVWVDPVGNVYIADSGNNRIRVVTVSGTIATVAGAGVPCAVPTSACGDGADARQAQFNSPRGI